MNNFLRQWGTVVFFGTIGINMLMGMSTMVIDWIPPDSRFILTLPLAIYALLTVLSGLDYNEHNVNPMPKECPPPPPRDPSTMTKASDKTLTTFKDIHEPGTHELVGYKGSKYGWFKAHRIYTHGDGEYTDDGKDMTVEEIEKALGHSIKVVK